MNKSDDPEKLLRELFGDPVPFEPSAYYNPEGDLIEAFFSSEDYYAEWLGPTVTVYRSRKTKEIIGCCIEGIKGIMKG